MNDMVTVVVRVMAWVFDLLLIGVPIAVLGITLFHLERKALLFFVVVFTLYVVVTPLYASGYTLGKRFISSRIISLKGKGRLTFSQMCIRHVFVPILYVITCGVMIILSLFMAMYREDRRFLHDVFAKTTVLRK